MALQTSGAISFNDIATEFFGGPQTDLDIDSIFARLDTIYNGDPKNAPNYDPASPESIDECYGAAYVK